MGDHPTEEDEIDIRGLNGCVLQAENLSIGYRQSKGKRLVVAEGLELQLNKGELVCLVGPNGVGKSTLLRSLAGLQPVLSGEVNLLGRSIKKVPPRELAQAISVVLTEQVNVGAMRAFDVVGLGRYPYTNWLGSLSQQDIQAICDALKAVNAEDLTNRFYNELSDGERQKILIARALAQEPLILLLDEPTAFLDLPRRVGLMQMLRDLAHELGKTILVSTHDLDLALHSADMIWLMSKNGQIKDGAPEDLVLSGQFEHAFAAQGVQFDTRTGNFVFSSQSGRKINVSGEGLAKIWTDRALNRAGFEVVADNEVQECQVEVLQEGNEMVWRLYRNGLAVDLTSIYALLVSLNE